MTVVVDASFALKWLVPEVGSDIARELLLAAQPITVPDILRIELTSALCRKERQRAIGAAEVDAALGLLNTVPGRVEPVLPLLDAATTLARAHRHALFDCLYLVQAQRSGAALATFDRSLAALATKLRIPLWTPA